MKREKQKEEIESGSRLETILDVSFSKTSDDNLEYFAMHTPPTWTYKNLHKLHNLV